MLAGHAPLIALLRPGMLTVYAGGEQTKIVVLGGFAEVGPDGLTVLADVATTVEDIDRAALQAQIAEMEARQEMEQGSELDGDRRLDHFKALDSTCKAPRCTDDRGPGGKRDQGGRVMFRAENVLSIWLLHLANFENAFTTFS